MTYGSGVRFDSHPAITLKAPVVSSATVLIVIIWTVPCDWHAFYFQIQVQYFSDKDFVVFHWLVAEEAPHWEWHCDYSVPGARCSPLHPQGHSLSLSTCLHHRPGAQPLLRQHMLQVGLCVTSGEITKQNYHRSGHNEQPIICKDHNANYTHIFMLCGLCFILTFYLSAPLKAPHYSQSFSSGVVFVQVDSIKTKALTGRHGSNIKAWCVTTVQCFLDWCVRSCQQCVCRSLHLFDYDQIEEIGPAIAVKLMGVLLLSSPLRPRDDQTATLWRLHLCIATPPHTHFLRFAYTDIMHT